MIIIEDFKKNYRRGELLLSEKKIKWYLFFKGILHKNNKINGLFGYVGDTRTFFFSNNGKLFLMIDESIFELTDDVDVLLTNEGDANANFYLYDNNNKILKKISYKVSKPFLIDYDFTQRDMADEDFGIFIYERMKNKKNRLALISAWSGNVTNCQP